jgi:DNA modification methylase
VGFVRQGAASSGRRDVQPTWKILQGDATEKLRELKDGSVQCCVTSPPYLGLRSYLPDSDPLKTFEVGLEETPEKYIERLVTVFAEVRRVLRDDGTCWVVIGDSYARDSRVRWDDTAHRDAGWKVQQASRSAPNLVRDSSIYKVKDLVGTPWMLAFALRADGFYLRSEIVWAKSVSFCPTYSGSCMPESVNDRCTRSHETIFMLSKSPRYFYDSEAVKEPSVRGAARSRFDVGKTAVNARRTQVGPRASDSAVTRNLRSVWTVNPQPSKLKHYAMFPEKLITPMVLAGTSAHGACSACGAPWQRVVESATAPDRPGRVQGRDGDSLERAHGADGRAGDRCVVVSSTVGWEPTCDCGCPDVVPCTVLDPFAGAGTTGVVALRLGRSFVGVELNPEYIGFAQERLGAVAGVKAPSAADEEPDGSIVDYSRVCWGEDPEPEEELAP